MHRLFAVLVALLGSCVLAACSPPAGQGETVFHNVHGYTPTADSALEQFTVLVIYDNKIIATGGDELLEARPGATHIDLDGKTLLPGLIDAHAHVLGLGQSRVSVDLRGIESAAAAASAVKAFADQHTGFNWIRGRGWNQVLWASNAFPSADILDDVMSERPVWLRRIDGHAGWANTAAMERAGITPDTADPAGGEIIRDLLGKPTGVFVDNAMDLVERHIPPPTRDEKRAELLDAMNYLKTLGITGVHDAGIDHDTFVIYGELADGNAMPIRINAMLSVTDPQYGDMMAAGPTIKDWLRIKSVKIYADGALGSRGAAMLAPYSDRPDQAGLMVTAQADLRTQFSDVAGENYQICIHAIGDRGNRIALDEFAHLSRAMPQDDARHRIEHAQVVAVEDIPRLKELGVIPSMQPTHATSDMNMAGDRIGSDRLAGAYAWRRFLDQGSPIASGSDFPVELANPFHGLHAAVTRQDHNNLPPGGWLPDQAMTMAEALKGFTLDAAYSAHREHLVGSLEEGKLADFIVVDTDIFEANPNDVWKTSVLQTWIGGKKVWASAPRPL